MMITLSMYANTSSRVMILVILGILTFVEISHCCHRRVEYHHFYKKNPHKGMQGHGHGHTHGHKHGKGYGGGGGHGHGGHSKGHMGHGHGGGGGYGMMKGHYGGMPKGHYGGMPKGHYGGMPKGHGEHMGGHGHGGHQEGGGGYGQKGHDHKGYGMQGYGMMGGMGGMGGNHHGMYEGEGYGMGEYGRHGENDDYGGMQDGYSGGGSNHGMSGGGGYGKGRGQAGNNKGRKFKYQMFETSQYGGDGHGSNNVQSNPHYTNKGYGYSGPYPNTEYSNPVETSVNPPNEVGKHNPIGSYPQLDAADTADLIRNAIEHDIKSYSNNANGGNSNPELIPTPTMEFSTGNSNGVPKSKVDPSVGNFDMNLNFNSDLPAPFRRSFVGSNDEPLGGIHRKRKRISSKYRGSNLSKTPDANILQTSPTNVESQSTNLSGDTLKDDSTTPEFGEFISF